ncbi:MAG: DUF2807 domain-containing protein, partial [Candidatus Marinimicrobia bacterium]|nr:DUF2807 domain-containing protein [Candidatus Neomarinimicrobiota bacterium]
LVLIFTVLLLFACDFDSSKVERIQVSGPVILEKMSFGDFSEIVIAGPIDVTLDQNQGSSLEVETYESLMPFFRAEIYEDALILYVIDTSSTMHFNLDTGFEEFTRDAFLSSSRLKWPDNKKVLKVHLSFGDLEKIQIIGECDMETLQTLKAEKLKLEVAGACHFDADLDVKVFDAEIAGAGNLDLRGSAERFSLDCAGAGTVKAYNFIADSVDLEIAGVCNAHVYAVESIDVEVAGMGTIKYMGNPSNISFEKAGIGSLKKVESEESEETEI